MNAQGLMNGMDVQQYEEELPINDNIAEQDAVDQHFPENMLKETEEQDKACQVVIREGNGTEICGNIITDYITGNEYAELCRMQTVSGDEYAKLYGLHVKSHSNETQTENLYKTISIQQTTTPAELTPDRYPSFQILEAGFETSEHLGYETRNINETYEQKEADNKTLQIRSRNLWMTPKIDNRSGETSCNSSSCRKRRGPKPNYATSYESVEARLKLKEVLQTISRGSGQYRNIRQSDAERIVEKHGQVIVVEYDNSLDEETLHQIIVNLSEAHWELFYGKQLPRQLCPTSETGTKRHRRTGPSPMPLQRTYEEAIKVRQLKESTDKKRRMRKSDADRLLEEFWYDLDVESLEHGSLMQTVLYRFKQHWRDFHTAGIGRQFLDVD